MSVLVVGSVALDSVETPFGVREEVLGGSATFFSYAASFFSRVQVVAVVGEDFPDEHLRLLRERNIDLSGLARRPGRTFRWKGSYTHQLNEARTLDTQLNVFETFEPRLSEAHRAAPFVFLGNIAPVLQASVLDQVHRPKLVAADTMNLWIRANPAELRQILSRVDLLFLNDAEARELAGEQNIVKAARAIMAMGPRLLAIKRGEYGSMLFDREQVFSAPAFPLADVFDPTGAGDTFAGGFLGFLARTGDLSQSNLRRALVVGTVLASFTVEAFSLDRLRRVSDGEIASRYQEFQRLTSFEALPS